MVMRIDSEFSAPREWMWPRNKPHGSILWTLLNPCQPHEYSGWPWAPEEHVGQSPDCGACAESQWAALKAEEGSGRDF